MARLSLCFALLLSCLAASAVVAQDGECRDFGVGLCDDTFFNNNNVIAEVTLPGQPEAFPLCQELCQDEALCEYFYYDSSDPFLGSCTLFENYPLLEDCQQFSGPASPPFNECLPVPGSSECKDIIEVDCEFQDLVTFSQDGVLYPYDCQEILQNLAITTQSTHWFYDARFQRCELLSSDLRTCEAVSGPNYPDAEDQCGYFIGTTTPEPTEPNRVVGGLGYNDVDGYLRDLETWTPTTHVECADLDTFPGVSREGAVSAAPAPGRDMWICGGSASFGVLDNCQRLSAESGAWTLAPDLNEARGFASSVITEDGLWVVTGGEDAPGVLKNTTEILGGEGVQWDMGPVLPEGRSHHCMVNVGRLTFIIGGIIWEDNPNDLVVADDVLVYDWDNVEAGFQRRAGTMRRHRAWHDCIQVGDRIMVVGGQGAVFEESTIQDTFEFFDYENDEWDLEQNNLPYPIRGGKLVLTTGGIQLVGGYTGEVYLSSILNYNPDLQSWTESETLSLDTPRESPVVQMTKVGATPDC